MAHGNSCLKAVPNDVQFGLLCHEDPISDDRFNSGNQLLSLIFRYKAGNIPAGALGWSDIVLEGPALARVALCAKRHGEMIKSG